MRQNLKQRGIQKSESESVPALPDRNRIDPLRCFCRSCYSRDSKYFNADGACFLISSKKNPLNFLSESGYRTIDRGDQPVWQVRILVQDIHNHHDCLINSNLRFPSIGHLFHLRVCGPHPLLFYPAAGEGEHRLPAVPGVFPAPRLHACGRTSRHP